MKEKGKITQSYTLICYLVALTAYLILTFLLEAVRRDEQIDEAGYVFGCYIVPQLSYLIVLGVFSFVKRIPKEEFFRPQNIKPLPYAFAVLIALGIFLFALLPNFYLQKALTMSGSKSTVILPPTGTAGEVILSILFVCILPAVGEEMMFRKTFCEGMEGNNEWVIIVLGGLFFSLSHLNLAQTVHQFFLGCVLCFLYVRTKNITLTMIAHFINNFLALFLERWTEGVANWTNPVVLGVALAIGAILLATGLFLVWKNTTAVKKNGGKVEPYTIILLIVLGVMWTTTVTASFFS